MDAFSETAFSDSKVFLRTEGVHKISYEDFKNSQTLDY